MGFVGRLERRGRRSVGGDDGLSRSVVGDGVGRRGEDGGDGRENLTAGSVVAGGDGGDGRGRSVGVEVVDVGSRRRTGVIPVVDVEGASTTVHRLTSVVGGDAFEGQVELQEDRERGKREIVSQRDPRDAPKRARAERDSP